MDEPYDYANRDGIEEIHWQWFANERGSWRETLAGEGVETIVGIARWSDPGDHGGGMHVVLRPLPGACRRG